MPRCTARRTGGETASSRREIVCGFGICYGHCDRNNPPLPNPARGYDRLHAVLSALAMLGSSRIRAGERDEENPFADCRCGRAVERLHRGAGWWRVLRWWRVLPSSSTLGLMAVTGSDASTCRCSEAASTVRAATRSSRLDRLRMHQKYLSRRKRFAVKMFEPRALLPVVDGIKGRLGNVPHRRAVARARAHFPIQNRLKITPSRSSEVNSPVIALSCS